jgi:DNA mismatch endonuclease (patch repair protein)
MANLAFGSRNKALSLMPDFLTKAKRSALMATIRSRGNKDTELVLARLFKRHHITGWRRHQQVLGRPDFIFRKMRVALFVDGCFWHFCPKHSHYPDSNRVFWRAKFSRNKTRDRFVTQTLRARGWRVLRIWEHELASRNEKRIVRRIQRALL